MEFLVCLSLLVGIGYVLCMIGAAIFSVLASFVGYTAAYVLFGLFVLYALSWKGDET